MNDDIPQTPAEISEEARWLLVDAGLVDQVFEPTIDCPAPAGTPEAERWWRDQWKKATAWAYAHGDLDAGSDDELPPSLPPYPVHALPPVMRNLAETIATNRCVPVDLAANLLFSLMSMVAAPRYLVDRGKTWREPLILWTLTILGVGEKKSPAFQAIGEILKSLDQWLAAEKRKETQQDIADLRSEVSKMRDGTSTKLDPNIPIGEQIQAREAQIQALIDDPPKPLKLRIGAGSTSESIERAMSRNGGQAAIFDDESAVFGNVSGVYNGGVPTSLDTILKGFDGSEVLANERIKRETETIPRACLTLGITCQPVPVEASFRVPQLRDRGFHARWTYSWPEPVAELVEPPDFDYEAADRFAELLKDVLGRPVIDAEKDKREWPMLTLSPEARKLHQEVQEEFIERKKPGTGDLGHIADWANKVVGRMLRFAGLMHLAGGRTQEAPIDEDTMRAAIEVGRYTIPHAEEVFRRAPKDPRNGRDVDLTAEVARLRVEHWVKKRSKTHFTTRDVHQTVKRQSWCHNIGQVESALASLARDWVIRSVPRRDAAGRILATSPWWVPNPVLVFGECEE